MKTLLSIIAFLIFPGLSEAEDLHSVIISKVSADHAVEIKSGDFTNRRTIARIGQTPEITSGNSDKSSTFGMTVISAKSAIANFATLEKRADLTKARLAGTERPR